MGKMKWCQLSIYKKDTGLILHRSARGSFTRQWVLWILLPFTFSFITLFTSCNETFQPLSNSETVPLSIYGYLDASADTQWVRVTPIREQLDMPLLKPEMEVKLEHPESGNFVMMNDSLVTMQGGFNVLNAWTTMDIKHGQTYRLEGKRPDGATSRVSVTIPGKINSALIESEDGCRASLWLYGIENLADIQSRWHIKFFYGTGDVNTVERFFIIPHRHRVRIFSGGDIFLALNSNEEIDQIYGQLTGPPNRFEVIRRDLFAASAGPEWIPVLSSISDLHYSLPESLSNVENGLGYLVGITSITIPWETCFR